MPRPMKPKHPQLLWKKGHKWEHKGDGIYELHTDSLKRIKKKLGAPEYNPDDRQLQEPVIMGKDLGGTCMTDTTRYDGEGEGGMCTLVYETRGQSDRAIGNTWENYFDISSDLKRRTFDENGKFEVYSKNMVYNFFSSENNYIIPSWMMHNSPYDCQLNCPRGNYWEITNVEPFSQFNPGSKTGYGANEETAWTTEGTQQWSNGEWWEGDVGCTDNSDGSCGDGGDMIYEASISCPYYASMLQQKFCATADSAEGWAAYPTAKYPFAWERPLVEDTSKMMGPDVTGIFSLYLETAPAGSFIAQTINERAPLRTIYDTAFATSLRQGSFMGTVVDVQPVFSSCTTCEAGRFNPVDAREGTNVTGCDPCPPGTYLPKTGQIFGTKCTVCKPGMFNEEWGQAYCKGCQVGRYARVVAGVFTITLGAPGAESRMSIGSRAQAEDVCKSSSMQLCSRAQVVAKGCIRTKGWTTDDAGYWCPETVTETKTTPTYSYIHVGSTLLGSWATFTSIGLGDTTACYNFARSHNAVQFQLINAIFFDFCFIYKTKGWAGGYSGSRTYEIIVTDVVTTTTRDVTWEPRSGNELIGAHCCATGYECTDCAVGKYSDEVGLLNCKSCQNAKYQDQTRSIECKNCPVGRKGSGLNKVSANDCRNCETGKYNDEPGTHPCKDCATGKYNTNTQSVAESACLNCATGQYAPVVGTTTCTKCEVGKFQGSTGQPTCDPCPIGRYTNSLGTVQCNLCQAGRWQGSTGKTECVQCNAGRYNGNTGSTAVSACVPCSGSVCSGPGAAACGPAPAGKYTNSAKECTNCPNGQYQNQGGQTGCKACGSGKYQNQQGTTSCKNCPGGQYQNQGGQSGCKSCSAGRYSGGGASSCSCCSRDHYSNGGASSCYRCGKLREPNWPYAYLASAGCGGCASSWAACHPCWGGFGIKPMSSKCCGKGNGDGCGAETLGCSTCWACKTVFLGTSLCSVSMQLRLEHIMLKK